MTYHFLLHVVLIVSPPGTSGAATSMPARGSIGDDGVLKAASRSAVEKGAPASDCALADLVTV